MSTAARLTVRGALRDLTERLSAATASPQREAELILAHLLSTTRTGLYLAAGDSIGSDLMRQAVRLAEERASGEPLQYLLGSAGFYGLDLLVETGVLIPRPETELLVERALGILPEVEGELLAIDLGAGSGAIAIALAANDSRLRVASSDISDKALCVARRNAERCGVADRVTFFHGDLFEPLAHLRGAVDLVVSNPPYISRSDLEGLPVDVRREPLLALDGGEDGLDFYRRIAEEAPLFLKTGGAIALEVGAGQAESVVGMLCDRGFAEPAILFDLADIDRVVIAVWPSGEAE